MKLFAEGQLTIPIPTPTPRKNCTPITGRMSAANLSIHAGNDTLARTLLEVGVGIGIWVEEMNKEYVAIRKNKASLR
jgi:hypothetical protein